MSEAVTSVSNKKYLENLRRFNTAWPPTGSQEKKVNSKIKNPIIIEEEDEDSSDCDSKRFRALETIFDSVSEKIKRLSELHKRKHTSSTFTQEQMQQNEADKEDPIEQRPDNIETDDDDSSSVIEYFLEKAKPNPHKAHSRADDPPKVQLGLTVTAQCMSILSTGNESSALRSLLEKPNPIPEKSALKHYKKQIIASTTGSAPIDLSYCQGNANLSPPRPFNLVARSYPVTTEKQMPTTSETNPEIQPSPGYSGGYSSYPAYPQNLDRELIVQSTNLASQSSPLVQSYVAQEPARPYNRFTVINHNPRTYTQNVIKTAPIDVQTNPQQYHQHNIAQTPNQTSSHPGNIYRSDLHPQIVQQRFTEKQLVVHQFYPQLKESYPNNPGHYLQTSLQYPSSFAPPQEIFPASPQIPQIEDLQELRYWAYIGKMAQGSMTKLTPSATYCPNQYPVENQQVYQVVPSGQDLQGLQETPAADAVEISQNFHYENTELAQSVTQNTLDEEKSSTPVENIIDQNLSLADEIESSALRTLNIPIETQNDTNDIEININVATDTPRHQVSEATEESANPGHAYELLRQLHNLFEDLKFIENTVIKKFKNKSCFDHSEIINKVKKTVNDYCAGETSNVTPSTSNVAVVKIRRLNYRDYINDDSIDDEDDTDEEDETYREPSRKRIRISSSNIVLPEEFDPTDSRWTLRYRRPGPGLVELMPGSGIYVNKNRLANCKKAANNSNGLARLLLAEIFSYNALTVCSLTGKPSRYHSEGSSRPGLDKRATDVLLSFIEQFAEGKKWPKVSKNSVLDSMRWKLTKMKKDAIA